MLTTYPHYATGKVWHGYKQQLHLDEADGPVAIRRVPIVPSHSRNAIGRILNYLSFAITSRLEGDFLKGADVIYVYSTPMTVAEGPRVWQKKWGLPFLLHVQDLWPDSVTNSGMLGRMARGIANFLIPIWLRSIYARASEVVAIAPRMRQMLGWQGVPEKKCSVVFNWANELDGAASTFDTEPAEERDRAGLCLLYAGNLGVMQDLDNVLVAMSLVRDLPNVLLRVAGSGVVEQHLKSLAKQLQLQNVEFLGRLESDELRTLYEWADFQLITLKNLMIFEGAIPSKLQAGLANGLPAITTVHGDVSDIICSERLGFVAEPENSQSIADALRDAYRMSPSERHSMSCRAKTYYANNMSQRQSVDHIEALLRLAAQNKEKGSCHGLSRKDGSRHRRDRLIRARHSQDDA